MDTENVRQNVLDILSKGGDIESVLTYLRDIGFSKIQSMKMLMDVKNLSLKEAKPLVHLSNAWKEEYENDTRTHDVIEEAARKLEDKNRP